MRFDVGYDEEKDIYILNLNRNITTMMIEI